MAEDRTSPETPDIVTRVHEWYTQADDHSETWREDARESFDFEAGRQWDEDTLSTLKTERRPAVVFNRVLRIVNAVVGTEINNRQETRYLPRELGDVQVNELLTGAGEWVRDETDAEDEESEAFRDLVTCGMGWVDTRMEFDEDPDGKVIEERIDPLHMFWDPGARKKNLSDARWVLRLHFFDPDEFWDTWPEAEITGTTSPWDGPTEDDVSSGRHTYPQHAYDDGAGREGARNVKQIIVGQAQWTELGTVYRVGGSAAEFSEDKFKAIRKEIEARNIPFLKQRRKVYHQAFIANGAVLEEGPCPCDTAFTLRAMTGLRDRNKNLWYGLLEAMKDPQRWGNKFFSQIIDILNKGAKGGVIAERDAVEDHRDFEERWARPDAVHWTRAGAISKKKIMPKPVVDLPASMDRLMAVAFEGVQDVSGVNLELLGLAERDQPGVLEYQRKQAGMTILAPFFDALRKFRKEQGRVLLHFIQNYISDGRLIRITGTDGKERFVPLVADPQTAKYDVIVDEAPTSPNQKEKVFGALSQLLPQLAKLGVPMPPELLDYAPIPAALTAKWKEMVEQGQELPPEVREQLQKLSQENQSLKSKREEAMLKIAGDREETGAKLHLKREEAAAEIAIKREQAEADIALERMKIEADIAIQTAKLRAEQEAPTRAIEDAVRAINVRTPKRRVSITRGPDGMIADAVIEDVMEDLEDIELAGPGNGELAQ